MIRKRDGKIVQVKRERSGDHEKYAPLKGATPTPPATPPPAAHDPTLGNYHNQNLRYVAHMTLSEFIAHPVPGFEYKPHARYMGQRERWSKPDGSLHEQINLGPDFFKSPPGEDRMGLLFHELGHDLMRNFNDDWRDVLEPYRRHRDQPLSSYNAVYDNPVGLSPRPEEMVADLYSSLMTSPDGVDKWSEKPHWHKLMQRVREVATRIGLPVPPQKPTYDTFVARLRARDHDDDAVQSYLDYALNAPEDRWVELAAKFKFSPDEAKALRQDLVDRDRVQQRERLRKEVARAEALALHHQPFADYGAEADGEPPPHVQVEPVVACVGRILGGLAKLHPEVRGLLAANLIRRIILRPKANSNDTATASYNPLTRTIEVTQPQSVNTSVLAHELGHAAEAHLADAGVSIDGPEWGRWAPAASSYASGDKPSEAWAEAWVAMLGHQREAFERHSPAQAKAVTKVCNHLQQLSKE